MRRNGGHINPPLYDDWESNKKLFGEAESKKLVQFRLAHVHEMQKVAEEENIAEASQVRVTEHLEVYFDRTDYEKAHEMLAAWKDDMPEEAATFVAYDGADSTTVGAFRFMSSFMNIQS